MKATRIQMMPGCANSYKAQEIATIYIDGCQSPGYYTKAAVHDYLKTNPNSIQVNIYPNPYLIPAISARKEKYVRSAPNDTPNDNLLRLPRH